MRACLHFPEIIELGVEELSELLQATATLPPSLERDLAQAIFHYQRGDVKELERLARNADIAHTDHPELQEWKAALVLRIELRNRTVSEQAIREAEACFLKGSRWQGELAILLGNAHSYRERHHEAQSWFEQAAARLLELGSRKKALKARLNALVCQSHLEPEANLISAYYDLAQSARKAKEFSVASTALLNIAREYQIMGGRKAALKFCSEAVRLAEHNFGSQHFYLALTQRAQLLAELGRLAEAQTDFECALAAPFPEVKAALSLVAPLLPGTKNKETRKLEGKREYLLPTWAERTEEKIIRFSALENRLLNFLADSPKCRIEILEHLYGARLSFETKANRLKSLLGTLRKKSPHLLICESGKYRIAEAIRPPARKQGG